MGTIKIVITMERIVKVALYTTTTTIITNVRNSPDQLLTGREIRFIFQGH